MIHGKTSKPARSLGCTTSTNSSQPNPFLRLHHSQWVALQAQLAMCASIRGSLIFHQGSPCIFLWRPLWHNKDSTKPSTPVLLAISTAPGRKIHLSLYFMLSIQTFQPKARHVPATLGAFQTMGINFNGFSQWNAHHSEKT